MTGKQTLAALKNLIADIDAGRPLRPFSRYLAPALIPAAIALGGVGCQPERHTNTADNTDTVIIDTNDGGQDTAPPDPVDIDTNDGGQQMPAEVCDDGTDNDGDGAMDCADADCQNADLCLEPRPLYAAPSPQITPALYAAPMPPPQMSENCSSGVDDDGDGAIDCADSDCDRDVVCAGAPVALYAAPPMVARYMAPFRPDKP